MPVSWTPEQVLSLAPDAPSAAAGRKQSSPGVWSGLGRSERALWGLCQGSGAKPYQTIVALGEPAFKCSCPSRKFPCKHALGLMLLWAGAPAALAAQEVPGWAASWLASRDERAQRARPPAAAADPAKAQAGAARRAARREDRVREGIAELRLWLDDLIRQGLAHAEQRGRAEWEQMAARLVDAQAPGLARRVRELAWIAGSGPDWPTALLRHAGLLSLLADAYARHGELPGGLAAEIRTQVGWTLPSEELQAAGERVSDGWRCVGQAIAEGDDRLRVRRTWLWGAASRRYALLLDFAHASQPLPPAPATGQTLDGELVFYPGAVPLRAQIAGGGAAGAGGEKGGAAGAGGDSGSTAGAGGESGGAAGAGGESGGPDAGGDDGGPVGESGAPPPPGATVAAAYRQRAEALAANPWADRHPVAIAGVPVSEDGAWLLADAGLDALPLLGDTPLDLAAFAGGSAVGVFGEWTRAGLTPLSAWDGERMIGL